MSTVSSEQQDKSSVNPARRRRRCRPSGTAKSSTSNMANKVLGGVTVSRPFVYGSTAMYLGKRHEFGNDSHRWTFFVRGLHGEDLSYLFKKVVFQLHPSCSEPLVVLTEGPFQVTQTGWGEFDGQIIMHLHDEFVYSKTRENQPSVINTSATSSPAKRPRHGDEEQPQMMHDIQMKQEEATGNVVGVNMPETDVPIAADDEEDEDGLDNNEYEYENENEDHEFELESDAEDDGIIRLVHSLRLFPQNSSTVSKKIVVYEQYDELVIHDPTQAAYTRLMEGAARGLEAAMVVPATTPTSRSSSALASFAGPGPEPSLRTKFSEADEMAKLSAAQSFVDAQLAETKQAIQAVQLELLTIKDASARVANGGVVSMAP